MFELALAALYLWAATQGASDGFTIAGEAILMAWCIGRMWQEFPGCIVCASVFMLLAPTMAEARPAAPSAQDMQLLATATCAQFIGLEALKGEDPKRSPLLHHFVAWRLAYWPKLDAGRLAGAVAIYCTDPDHAAVTLEQATGAIYDAATTPNLTPADGKKLQEQVQKETLISVLSSPYSNEAQRWVAAHVLANMNRETGQ
jgi:hypothetical protein